MLILFTIVGSDSHRLSQALYPKYTSITSVDRDAQTNDIQKMSTDSKQFKDYLAKYKDLPEAKEYNKDIDRYQRVGVQHHMIVLCMPGYREEVNGYDGAYASVLCTKLYCNVCDADVSDALCLAERCWCLTDMRCDIRKGVPEYSTIPAIGPAAVTIDSSRY